MAERIDLKEEKAAFTEVVLRHPVPTDFENFFILSVFIFPCNPFLAAGEAAIDAPGDLLAGLPAARLSAISEDRSAKEILFAGHTMTLRDLDDQ